MSASVVSANIEEGVERLADVAAERAGKRGWLWFLLATLALVLIFAGSRPFYYSLQSHRALAPVAVVAVAPPSVEAAARSPAVADPAARRKSLPPPSPSPLPRSSPPPPSTAVDAAAMPATCGEEAHMDPQGHAVVDGRGHHVESAAECCAACAKHAAKFPSKRPCNSWVFCGEPHCWSADNGNTHLFGECWLKWQSDPSHPLYGQRGAYTGEYRRRNGDKHLNGQYPTDANSAKILTRFGIAPGSRRNLTIPSHVVWIGGVMGAKVDRSVTWTTDADGTMRSSAGDVIVDYRPCALLGSSVRSFVLPP